MGCAHVLTISQNRMRLAGESFESLIGSLGPYLRVRSHFAALRQGAKNPAPGSSGEKL